MANSTFSNPAAGLGDAARFGEIRGRLLFLVGALIVYRIGTYIPVPGINPSEVARFFTDQSNTILGIVNMFSGGALSRLSIFAMGVMPYISASIIIQMMSMVIPTLMELRKEGESGRRKITEYTRYATVVLAAFQSFAAAGALVKGGLTLVTGWQFLFTATVTMTTGTMFLMWLGEQITSRGIGNGSSLIIFAGIVAAFPSAVANTLELGRQGQISTGLILTVIVMSLAVVGFIVFMERAQRRLLITYPKRQQGNRMYEGQTSFLPLKLNTSGVIPPIFASSLLSLPTTVANFSQASGGTGFMATISLYLGHGRPLYMIAYVGLIVFFAFFYTAIVFNPTDTADNLKKHGGFIPGIRPGERTAQYIDQVLMRITCLGAAYLALICLLPEMLISYANLPFYFGGTSLLIVVSVTMDTVAQIHGHLQAHQYEGLVRKAKLRGRRR